MQSSSHFHPDAVDFYVRRGRQLRSATAIALLSTVGRAALHVIERAFVRPYRMTGTPGCGCEA